MSYTCHIYLFIFFSLNSILSMYLVSFFLVDFLLPDLPLYHDHSSTHFRRTSVVEIKLVYNLNFDSTFFFLSRVIVKRNFI